MVFYGLKLHLDVQSEKMFETKWVRSNNFWLHFVNKVTRYGVLDSYIIMLTSEPPSKHFHQ